MTDEHLPKHPDSLEYLGHTKVVEVAERFLAIELPEEVTAVPDELKLFHYCSTPVYILLMQRSPMWMSDLRFMNDTSELSRARELLLRLIGSPAAGVTWPDLETYIPLLPSRKPYFAFCSLSLSQDPDSLPQWRSYCRPNEGYAVGYDRRSLEPMCRRFGMRLLRCLYDESAQLALLAPLAADAVAALNAGQALSDAWIERFHLCAAVCKHPAFATEQEWRIVAPPVGYPSSYLKYRPGLGAAVPYITFPPTKGGEGNVGLQPNYLVIGPTLHAEAAYRGAWLLSHIAYNLQSGPVHSKIPYRATT